MVRRISLILVLLGVLGLTPASRGAGSDILITWKSNAYIPAEYGGKSIPSANSEITASVALVADGKAVDLGRHTVNWYRDDQFVVGGTGKTRAVIRAGEIGNSVIELRVEIPTFTGGDSIQAIDIPVGTPRTVIVPPFSGSRFSDPRPQFRAVPYFFNVNSEEELSFSWKINGKRPADESDSRSLEVEIRPGTADNFSLFIQSAIENSASALERALSERSFTYHP